MEILTEEDETVFLLVQPPSTDPLVQCPGPLEPFSERQCTPNNTHLLRFITIQTVVRFFPGRHIKPFANCVIILLLASVPDLKRKRSILSAFLSGRAANTEKRSAKTLDSGLDSAR